eukprot:1553168-Pleurochrysis_carterae.AAC.1
MKSATFFAASRSGAPSSPIEKDLRGLRSSTIPFCRKRSRRTRAMTEATSEESRPAPTRVNARDERPSRDARTVAASRHVEARARTSGEQDAEGDVGHQALLHRLDEGLAHELRAASKVLCTTNASRGKRIRIRVRMCQNANAELGR